MPARPRADRRPSASRTLGWLAAGLGTAGLLTGLVIAPPDALQGNAARLMYLHVPAAWVAYLAFAVVFVASAAHLRRQEPRFTAYARAAAEIGVVLTALTIAFGAVWGHLVWGTWWVWDPRLVSTAMLLVVYLGYLATRGLTGRDGATSRAASFVGVAGFALVPVVHFSVVWWRSVHQQATLLAPSTNPPIDAVMAAALTLSVAAFTAGAAWLFLRRVTTLRATSAVSALPPTVPADAANGSPR
ncbi:cytochrome c biogenesis protein CcsA [Actinophytocola glycyrrhizae]|uniref:Heme exporter protein C n=1 Tax=Actinophytocola glycyrrhizae TaxID=2044873 RepID=A0ABV9SHG3_9PSEU